MPLLYGPLAIHFYYREITTFLHYLYYYYYNKPQPSHITANANNNNNNNVVVSMQKYYYCRIIIWSGLILLSLAPHQEARFLLPLGLPLVLLYGNDFTTAVTAAVHLTGNSNHNQRQYYYNIGILICGAGTWVIWTCSLGYFYNILHQGAVLPSLLHLSHIMMSQQQPNSAKAIIYYHTYMPPTFLLRRKSPPPLQSKIWTLLPTTTTTTTSSCSNNNHNNNNNNNNNDECCGISYPPMYDLKGSPKHVLFDTLTTIFLPTNNNNSNNNNYDIVKNDFVYVIAPYSSVMMVDDNENDNQQQLEYNWTQIWSQFQISTEDLPTHSYSNSSSWHLVIWRVQPI